MQNRLRFALGTLFVALAALALPDITLRLSTWEGDEGLKIQRDAVHAFEAAHPGIHVKLENNEFGLYFQKLLTQYAANVAPDVSMMGFEHFQAFAKRGVLLPLDDLAAKSPNFSLADYYPEIVEAHRYDGHLYVLPRDIAPMGLVYYNKKAFDEAGIPYPDGTWTWDFHERPELKEKDFLWVMHKLSKSDASGRPVKWGFTSGWPNLFALTIANSSGAREVDDYAHPKKVLYNSPEMIRAYQFCADVIFKDKWAPSMSDINSILQTNSTRMFEQGQVAMMEGGIWEVPNIRRELKPGDPSFFEWDITLFPAYAKTGQVHFPSGGSGYAILSTTEHPKEAWELVQWLAGPPGLKGLAEHGLAQPAIRKMALSEPWIPGPNTPLEMRYPPSRRVTDEAVPHIIFPPTSEYWSDVSSGFINPRLDPIWTGERDPKAALDQATKEAQDHLDTLNRVESLPPFNWWSGIVLGLLLLAIVAGVIYWPERNVKRTNAQKAENRSAYFFLAPWIIGMIVFTIGPMALSLLMSTADWDIIQPARFRGIANYTEALGLDPTFWDSLKVTSIYTVFSVPLGLMCSLGLALLLNQKIKGMPLFRTCYYIPSVASAVASALVWKKMFNPDNGFLNTLIYGPDGKGNILGLATLLKPLVPPGQEHINWIGSEKTALLSFIIMSLWGFGSVIVLLAGLQGIPSHYYEAAMLDGAGPFRRFRNVTLPLLTPALFFCLVTGAIGSFQNFTASFTMTGGGPGHSTLFYMLHLYNNAFSSLRMGYASALAWILFVIIMVLTLFQFKLSKWVYTEGG